MLWHSKEQDVYHTCTNCDLGNNIEDRNLVRDETGGKRLCERCHILRNSDICRDESNSADHPSRK